MNKDMLLKILYRIWSVGIPIMLALIFAFSCFMGLWKTLSLPLWVSIVLTCLIAAICVFAVGKWIKLW